MPAFPVERVVDTTGAGDLFAAGFLFGLARGADHRSAARLGALAAAEVIQHLGARPERSLAALAQENGWRRELWVLDRNRARLTIGDRGISTWPDGQRIQAGRAGDRAGRRADRNNADRRGAAGANACALLPFCAARRIGCARRRVRCSGRLVRPHRSRAFAADPAKAAAIDEIQSLQTSIAQLSAELAALKASVEASSKSAIGQFARIAERIERGERAHAEPAARLAKIAENLERLDRRARLRAGDDRIEPPPAAPAETKATAEVKASAESKEASKPAIVTGWIIRDVYRGRIALLENRYGVYEVEPGSNVPGVGRVESIKRQDGHWVVVTPKGLITSYR